jgi:hypothetical protein
MKKSLVIRVSLLAFALLLNVSCASDDEKTTPVEVEMATKAFLLSLEVKDSFLTGDVKTLQSLCSKKVYDKLVATMDDLSGWKIDFKMRWVDIDDEGTVHLYISWKRDSGREEENIEMSGLALFVITEDPFIVEEIMRENPFLL